MEGKLPPEVEDSLQALQIEAEALLRSNRRCGSQFSASLAMDSPEHDRSNLAIEGVVDVHDPRMENHGDELELLQNSTDTNAPHILAVTREATPSQGVETSSRSSGNSTPRHSSHGEAQLIEQFEPGVYVTLVQLQDGTKVFKQVRFSKRRFAEQQAEEWWKENQERVLKKYNHPAHTTSSQSMSAPPAAEEQVASSEA